MKIAIEGRRRRLVANVWHKLFEFAPGSDRIICERPYYDQGAVLRALGLG